MWGKRKQLIIASAVAGLLAAAAPALEAIAGDTSSPFGKVNQLDSLQEQIDALRRELRDSPKPQSPKNLSGDYALLANLDCMYDTPAFAPNLTVSPPGPHFFIGTQHQTLFGTIHYNADGTASETLAGMGVSDQPFQGAAPISTYTVSCSPTYVMNADGSFIQTRTGCTSTGSDGTITNVSGTVTLQGRVSNGGKILLLAGITPSLETVSNSSGSRERVCTRNMVATKIK
jgi:hypothetical protein